MNETLQTIECLVYLIREDDGRFSVLAANLPGAASHGDTEDDALANIVEALEGVIAAYGEAGEEIPWTEDLLAQKHPDAKSCRVVVHAESQ